ncbi:MAG: FHA domain-containing protein [Desulfovibrionaceae bacterium]|nr:FHA domain-containing protein [Desulfovibrionaceae bacterium]
MKLGLRIEHGGATIADMELDQGDHVIGRAPECAVVLPDRAVSSRHALLRIGETSAELIDQESLNGMHLEGRKVAKIPIARDLTVEICGHLLHFHPKARSRRLLPALPALSLRLAVLSATAVLALGVLCAAWIPGNTALRENRLREGLQRGALLVRSLAEQNILPLRAKLLDQVRVTPVSAEEGVLQAYVTDPYGKILAPPKDLGKALDNPQALAKAAQSGVNLWTEPDGETWLTCPVRDGETLLGLAVLTYDPLRAVPGSGSAAGLALGLACAVLLWAVTGAAILRLTLGPARRLAEDMGVALKSGAGALAFRPPSREYAELKQAAERLLVLAAAAEPQKDAPAGHAPRQAVGPAPGDPPPPADVAATPGYPAAPAPSDSRPPVRRTAGEDGAWCLISLDDYRLVQWSPGFAGHLAVPDLAPPVHLLTALADPALLSAVAEAVDDPAPQAERPVQGQSLVAVKRPGTGPGVVRVEITETA